MKYNSVENAETFLREQVAWCLSNGYKDFSIWSNGEELRCLSDSNDIGDVFARGEVKSKGFWRAFRMINGEQVSVLA